jgi:hypothetical protein
MKIRIATAIFGVLFATAAAHAQTVLTIPMPPAEATEPTSMPDSCADRDVDCVLYDGPPRRAVVGASVRNPPGTTTSATGATGAVAEAPAGSASIGARMAR